MSRLRSLVDAAYACDPRILRFKEEDKQKKLDVKKAKQDAARARQEEEERVRASANLFIFKAFKSGSSLA